LQSNPALDLCFCRIFCDEPASISSENALAPPARWREAWSAAPILLDAGGEGGGFAVPRLPGLGIKLGATVRREPADDADAAPALGPADLRRILTALAPLAAPEAYRLIGLRPCLYAVAPDERFHAARHGRALVLSACSGHGYKFGAAVGRRVADAIETGDTATLSAWLRAEQKPGA
jgi:sarcosine oxidase